MLVVLILVQRLRIQGATGVDIDALPGHAPVGRD
jgi:hypothetical protein